MNLIKYSMHSVYHMLVVERRNNSLKFEIVLEPDNPCNLQVLKTYFQKITLATLSKSFIFYFITTFNFLFQDLLIYNNEIMIISDLFYLIF